MREMNRHERRVEAAIERGKFIPSRDLRERYRVSDMSIWRWLRNDELAFPKPTIINGRRYWLIDDLEQWERARAAQAATA
jgi:predicted DNA-binding transcriptional regulator AlpA